MNTTVAFSDLDTPSELVAWSTSTPSDWLLAVEQMEWHHNDSEDSYCKAGTCPRCGHEMHFVLPKFVVQGLGQQGSFHSADGVLIQCNCIEEHDGHPEGKFGCGCKGMFSLPSSLQGDIVANLWSNALPRHVTEAEEYRDTETLALKIATLGNLRAAAEKWTARIYFLLWLIGLFVFVSMSFDQMTLILPWRLSAALCVILGLLSFGLSIFWSALAMQGIPTEVWGIGADVRSFIWTAEKNAVEALQRSRWAALAGIILLLLAVAIAWFAPRIE